ncbi:PREDICTED: alpha-ketoglutarate-dependent taurine dioxygenase-like isoform X1 [Diuraphis noxia]|uniref:alpha-ketoglutarate-dependent taurine dioxygenase-like isoform X1 n=2 Tax=Diuraphis noxia TaxID=143948 RepID=UPI000763825B|nr:PREDICTED: alpha-ketoglutarate-dependent taurine dioxygenase-like isoform X1 [Diuraphis noxia]XP_015366094.1 PREDICTED: alpha-ketoglutarate-dependent taurine dioxygenase-like isoform X1 [Diuraphis noxia]
MSRNIFNKMEKILKPIGCEVRGIDLKTENRPEIIKQIQKDVTEHRMLIFKDQGIISGDRHVEISRWFGELESTFYRHPKSPHLDVFRVSNDKNEGCTGVGRSGWHIDGTFQPAPFSYSLYHMVSVPKEGHTLFVPLTELIESLDKDTYDTWNKAWMVSDRRSSPIHPLVYSHPLTGKPVLCFHLGMTTGFIWNYKLPSETTASHEEYEALLNSIESKINQDNGKYIYIHKWEPGDFIISDNLAVGHFAHSSTQAPRSEVGLRVLHRTTVKGTHPPKK